MEASLLLHISDHSDQSLQQQIIGQIRARILSGDLTAEVALPSIRSLAKDLKVSVITVQRAYDALLVEKLIYSRRGKGFFVALLDDTEKNTQAKNRFAEQLQPLLHFAKEDGLSDKDIKGVFQQQIKELYGDQSGDE